MMSSLSGAFAQTNNESWTINLNPASTATIIAGQNVVFTARVNNGGNGATSATKVNFKIPKSSKFIGITGFANCVPLPKPDEVLTEALTVTCDVPPLDRDGEIAGEVIFAPQVDGVMALAGSVDGDVNAHEEKNVTVIKGADVALKLDVPERVKGGADFEFKAVITNNGPHSSTNSILTFPIPSGVSMRAPLPAGCAVEGNQIVCKLADELQSGENRELVFPAKVTAGSSSTVSIEATLVGDQPADPDLNNNQDDVILFVDPATDVSLIKTRSPNGGLQTGDAVEFTLTPDFAGDEPKLATIIDTLPENYVFKDVIVPAGSGWSCGHADRIVTCNYQQVAGSNYKAPVVIQADAVSVGVGVVNTAVIQSPDEDPDFTTNNNTAKDRPVNIEAPVKDLVAHKTGPRSDIVVVGNEYNFRLSATNAGNGNFTGEVTITDHLPAGMEISENTPARGAGWSCSPSFGVGPIDIVCTTNQYTDANPLAPGARTAEIIVPVKVTAEGAYSNGMTVSYPGWLNEPGNGGDATQGNNTTTSDGTASTELNSADITLRKTIVGSDRVNVGDEVEFAIEIINNGAASAFNVTVDDRIDHITDTPQGGVPEALTPTIVPQQARNLRCVAPKSGAFYIDLDCQIDELPVCQAGVDCPVVTVKTYQGGAASAERVNTAHIFSTTTPDKDLTNNSSSVNYNVQPKTDLTVVKASSAETTGTPAGQDVVYTISAIVPRNGLSDAQNVVITDILPDGVYFVRATTGGSICTTPEANSLVAAGNNTIRCEVGSIRNGAEQVVTVVVKPTTAQVGKQLENNATVTTSTPEVDTTNNAAKVFVEVTPPVLNLHVKKTDEPYDPVTIDDPVTYTITATNDGPSNAHDVVITDTLPTGGFHSPVVQTLPAGWACTLPGTSQTAAGGQVICTTPLLEAGKSVQFQIKMTSFERGNFINNVVISSEETEKRYETELADNQDSEQTRVRARADVSIVKTPSKDKVDLHEKFIWNMVVRNASAHGIGIAENVVLTDTLPSWLDFVGFPKDSQICSYATSTRKITCELGDLQPGASATVDLETKIIALNSGEYKNTASVTTDSYDENPSDNTSSGVVLVKTGSVKGQIYADFDNDQQLNNGDKGLGGITVTIEGITEHDGQSFKKTVTTDAAGNYDFTGVPSGTYNVTYSNVPDADKYEAGKAIAGTSSEGTPSTSGANQITGIVIKDEFASEKNDFTLIPVPSVGLSKVAGVPAANADGTYRVAYTFTIKNLSQEPVKDVVLTDVLNGNTQNFGTYTASAVPSEGEYSIQSVSSNGGAINSGFNGAGNNTILSNATIAVNASLTATVEIMINPKKPWVSNPLILTNQAEVTGKGEYSNKPVQDLSDKNPGGENDPARNEPTTVPLGATASIGLEKTGVLTLAGAIAAVGDRIDYTFKVTNTGETPLFDVKIEDPMPDLVWAKDSAEKIDRLDVGASDDVSFKAYYLLKQADIDAGMVKNTAKTSGKWAEIGGVPQIVDASDTEEVKLEGKPALTLVKEAAFAGDVTASKVGEIITYTFTLTNTGNLTLTNVVVTDPLPGLVIPVDTIATLLPGQDNAQTLTATYAITQEDIERGKVDNTATATGDYVEPGSSQTETLAPVEDKATVPLGQKPGLAVIKKAESKLTEPAEVGQEIVYSFTVHNTGNMTLRGIVLNDPLPGITPSSFDVGTLLPGEQSKELTATYKITEADIDAGQIVNQAKVTGTYDGVDGPGTSTDLSGPDIEKDEPVIVPAIPPSPDAEQIVITKQAMLHQVRRGDRVPYIIKVENTLPKNAGFINVIDTMPSGFRYVEDSALVDGQKFIPEVNGRRISFKNLKLGPNQIIEIRLELLVLSSAGPGQHVNIASVTDRDGVPAAKDARAIVEILAEAVFDCGEIIGTVFDDKNRNGYQDEGEKGLPGVRVATAKGWLITTDRYGRFHVPCAALPEQRIGSNFIMKLDTRTLPTGYRLTTENPRVVRLTAGKMTKLNFGASISRVVRLDLQAAAFENNSVELKKQWKDNLKSLVTILRQEVSVLRLTYKRQTGETSLAKDRIKQVRKHINDLWKKQGDNYPLEIETRVEVGK